MLFIGSVGSIVVQLAKSIPNTTVVAVAGGDDKCAWVKETLGADIALNYKADGFAKLFRQTLKVSFGFERTRVVRFLFLFVLTR